VVTHPDHASSGVKSLVALLDPVVNCSLLGTFVKLQKETASFIMSVRPSICLEQLGAQWRIFMKFDI
jgi:hypothetical protein